MRTVTFQPIESPRPTITTQTNTIVGTAGAPGQPGVQGLQGIRGSTGMRGQTGGDGAMGAKGQTGERGDQGAQGERGNKGETGEKGDDGNDGTDGDPATDDQTLSFSLATYGLTITDGNTVDLSVLAAADADSDPTNEIQAATAGGGLFVATDNSMGLMTTCGIGEILKWDGTAWVCDAVATTLGQLSDVSVWTANAGDILVFDGNHWVSGTDANTTYTAGSGLSLAGTTFNTRLAVGGGLVSNGGGISLLNTCSDGQLLVWSSGGLDWSCASMPVIPTTFGTVTGDTGAAIADSSSDILAMVGGDGVTVTASDSPEEILIDIDLASGGGLAFSSGQLRMMSCSNGQILKVSGGNWGCALDDITPNIIYRQQLSGTDNVTVHSSFTPLLTNGSGTPQSLPITITSGSQVGFLATFEFSSTLGTGPMVLGVVRDDNGDNDCGTTAGDGTRVGGIATEMIGVIGQAYTKTLSFVDDSTPGTALKYQLCASTTIAIGAVVATDRSLKLEEVSY